VAKHADWWNYCDTPEVFGQKLEILRQHCLEIGRPFDEIVKTWDGIQITVAESDAEAQRIFEASPYRRRGRVVGTPDRVAARLKQYIDLGVDISSCVSTTSPNNEAFASLPKRCCPKSQIAHANARQGAHV
jgi:alkanesulfonate monooxygenase SsuD/methylene tetrahydromethanopterin reductase-like flavin-dependent oxidoreductase (luciferase family)